MQLDDPLRDSLVLLLTSAPQDGHAIMRAMGDAGIAAQLCTAADLSREVWAGVGAIVLLEEAMSKTIVRQLATVIEEQVIWSDIPLIILTTPKRDASAHWRLIQNAPSIRNATFLERPMRIATLLQAVKVALRGREKQYRLRDQMREREQLLAHSEQNERRLSAVLNNTRMAVFFMDERQHCTYMNAAAENLTGYSLVEARGRSLHDMVHHSFPDGRPYPIHECPIDRAFPEYTQTEGEEVFIHKDGHFFPVAFTASPIRQEEVVVGTVVEVRDISRRKAEIEHLHMLLDELNHRVKNTLATVQSICLQTLRGEVTFEHAKDGILSRLTLLARSHDLLTERNWVSAPLPELARRALAPFGATGDEPCRVFISGDAVELRPQSALAIALGLHELATNAVKYGALSTEGGSVDLSWMLIPGDVLRLRWVERGGPAVRQPVRSGFGLRLIQRGLAHELAGEARIVFHADGVICEIDVPAATALVATKQRISDGKSEPAGRPNHPGG